MQSTGPHDGGQIGQRRDLEKVEERFDPLGTEAGYAGQIDQRGRQTLFEFFQIVKTTGRRNFGNLAGQVLANSGQVVEVASFGNDCADVARKIFNCARGIAIGANPERISSVDLKEHRVPLEAISDVSIVRRDGRPQADIGRTTIHRIRSDGGGFRDATPRCRRHKKKHLMLRRILLRVNAAAGIDPGQRSTGLANTKCCSRVSLLAIEG